MEQQPFNETREEGLFEESINLRHYWHIVLERRWLVAATFLVVIILTAFYLFSATPIFSATTRLQIDRETENALRMESFVMEGAREQDYLQTQYKNLQSRSLMEMVLEETLQNKLILDGLKAGRTNPKQLIGETGLSETNIVERLHQISKAGFFGLTGYAGGNAPKLTREDNRQLAPGLFAFPPDPKEGEEAEELTHEEQLKLLSDSVSVSPIRLSRLVDVSVESPNRNEAALIANTVISKFLEQDNSRKRGKLANAVDFLREEATNLSTAVHTNYMALHNFKLEWDIISLEDSQNTTLQALLKAQTDYDAAHSRAVEAQAAADEAQRVFTETGEYGTIPDVAADAEVKQMRGDLALAEAELASLRERYLEKHPKIIEKRSSIEALQESLKSAEKRIFDSIVNKAKLAKATDTQLAGVLTILPCR